MSPEEIAWLSKVFRKIDMFSTLSMADVGDLIDHMQKRRYPNGATIVSQGERGDSFYIIYKGRAAVRRGWFLFSRRIGELLPEQFFGEIALLSDEPRNATVKAAEDTECFVLSKGHFEHLLKKNPSFTQTVRALSEKRRA